MSIGTSWSWRSEIANLPAWVVALVAAGGLAAALSTAAGLLLVISSSVSHDLGKSILNPNMSEKSELRLARVAAGGAVILAGYFRHSSSGFCGTGGRLCLWSCRKQLLSGHYSRDFQQAHHQGRSHCGHALWARVYSCLHLLLQIHAPGGRPCGLVVPDQSKASVPWGW